MRSMDVAGSDYGHFQRSLANGDFGSAWAYATSLSHVDLADALRLTCLSLKNHPKRFEPLARRWLARYIEECKPNMDLISWAAALFGQVQTGDTTVDEVEGALRKLLS